MYSNWLAKNVDRGRCKALQLAPIRQEISRLKYVMMEETGAVDIQWQCQWTLRSYHAALKGLLRICRQHSSSIDLRGNLIFNRGINKSSPKSFGKSRIATTHAENGLTHYMRYCLCSAHCRRDSHSAAGMLCPHHTDRSMMTAYTAVA